MTSSKRPRQANQAASAESGISAAFLRHLPGLKKFLSRFVLGKHDIDDIAQETYLRAFQAERKAEPVRSPRAYLFRIARNIALNELSRKSRQVTDYIEDSIARDVIEEAAPPDERAAHQERLALFCEAVATLPLQCRRAFLLKKVYGYSQKEIARELGIAVSTVEKHVARGLLQCSRHIEQRESQADARAAADAGEEEHVSR